MTCVSLSYYARLIDDVIMFQLNYSVTFMDKDTKEIYRVPEKQMG